MLLGEYEHTIDDKNRLTLPAKFREAFSDGCVVTRGLDGCLWAWTPEGWENYRESILGPLHPLSKESRQMQRHFFSGASETMPDKQGRVSIPPALLAHAKLGRDVVVADGEVLALTIGRAGFAKLVRSEPALAQALLRTLAARIRAAERSDA